MKKLVGFALVTLLFLSGCGNQATVPTDTLSASSQAVNLATESPNEPYFPKDTITEKAPEASTNEPLATPESKPTETETVPVPQAETSIDTPQEPQHKAETDPPATDTEESSNTGRNTSENAARAA